MGSSWALVCASTYVLLFLSSDECSQEQREVTDLVLQDMMQKPVDITHLLQDVVGQEPLSPLEPSGIGFSRPEMAPRGRQPSFDPRSYGGPAERYPVQFPLGRPTFDNLEAICLNADRRPRYTKSYFPASGFGSQVRRGNAVNRAESWFSTCCERRETWEREVTLCCATQAWELSIQSFCEEEFSVKTRHHHCCRPRGMRRLNCFHSSAQNPNYEPTEEIPVPPLPSTDKFEFDPNTCQREMNSSASQKINFPPGRPTADTIKSLCHNQMLRPLYNLKCLPGSGLEWLARQAKTINRMEKGFEKCCKRPDMLNCADQKWREEINMFCMDKKGGQVDFPCCSADGTNDRYSCFQQISPDPYYNMTSATEELSLNAVCNTHKIIGKTFPLKSFVAECCPLPQDKTMCSVQKLEEMLGTMCSSGRRKSGSSNIQRCCNAPAHKASRCVFKYFMDVMTKATRVLRQKKKKCPIS